MKTIILLITLLTAVTLESCGGPTILASLGFTPNPGLDKKGDPAVAPDNPGKYGDKGDKKCGSTESFDFTNTTGAEIGILQIQNTGDCALDVAIASVTGAGPTKTSTPIGNYSIPSGAVGKAGDVTSFDIPKPAAGNTMTIHVTIVCNSATAGNCIYTYKFSTAKNEKTPTTPKLDISEPPAVQPPKMKNSPFGTGTAPNKNPCVTDEVILKTIRNLSGTPIVVHFTAQSTCDCDNFEAYCTGSPTTSKAAGGTGANPTKGNEGTGKIPKKGTIKAKPAAGTTPAVEADVVYIKASCPYDQKEHVGPCAGKVTDISIGTK